MVELYYRPGKKPDKWQESGPAGIYKSMNGMGFSALSGRFRRALAALPSGCGAGAPGGTDKARSMSVFHLLLVDP
ncbi:hypothetical protein D3C85_1758030 [compost metagenome]